MRIPKKFKINGNEWRVRHYKRLSLDGDACDGLCESDTKTIKLVRGMSPEQETLTFLHEFIHASLRELHFTYGDSIPATLEEIICDGLATIFLANFEFTWRRK